MFQSTNFMKRDGHVGMRVEHVLQFKTPPETHFLCAVHELLATSQCHAPPSFFLIRANAPAPISRLSHRSFTRRKVKWKRQMEAPVVADAAVHAHPVLAPLSNTTIRHL